VTSLYLSPQFGFMMQSSCRREAVAQGQVVGRLKVGSLHDSLKVWNIEFDDLPEKFDSVPGFPYSLPHKHCAVCLGIVDCTHDRHLLRQQGTNGGNGILRPFGCLNNRPRVEHHPACRGQSSRCVVSGTHPPPCRSASRTSTRSGPSYSISTNLLRKSIKSVALSRASRYVEGAPLGGAPGSAMSPRLLAA